MRQSMMPVRYSAINKTSNSGQSMMATVMVTAATCNQKEKIEKHVPTPTEDTKGRSSVSWAFLLPLGCRILKFNSGLHLQATVFPIITIRVFSASFLPGSHNQVHGNGHTDSRRVQRALNHGRGLWTKLPTDSKRGR